MQDENDELQFEESDEDGEVSQSDTIKKLRAKLKESEAKAHEYLTGWQKERAELVNARKRDESEKQEFVKFANERLLLEVLPALDSFDMAFANKESWAKLPPEWTKGMEYIYSQLLSSLEANGLKRLYPLGEMFDPARDEAIEAVQVEKLEDDHKIMHVIQPGYSLNGKIVRTTKVKVGELKS